MDALKNEENSKNISRYKRERFIVAGSFGNIWEGTDVINNSKIAMKIEHDQAKHNKLDQESYIYHVLQKNPNYKNFIPTAHCFFSDEENQRNVLVLDLLGPSLHDIFLQCGKKFSMKTILNLAIRMLDILEFIHGCGISHNDIKPSNFVIGRQDFNRIFLLDFGLSEDYIDRTTGELFECELYDYPTGTSPFSSLRVHWGVKSGRRDDIASIAYILLYFLRGDLPWDYAKCDWNEIFRLKAHKYWPGKAAFEGFPKVFVDFFDYVDRLVFDIMPDFNVLRKFFLDEADALSIKMDDVFDWDQIMKDSMKVTNN